MIGSQGNFDINNIEDAGPEGTQIMSGFGRVFGAEDGWSEEMQNIGNVDYNMGYALNKRFSRFKRGGMQGIPEGLGFDHPMAGFEGFGYALNRRLFAKKGKRYGMSGVDYSMGNDGQMGFDFAALKADLTKQVNAELTKAKTNLTTAVKAQVGTTVANTANKILAQPEIQKAMIAQGKDTAVQNVAQTIAKQITEKSEATIAAVKQGAEVAKKYSIPLLAIGGLGLAYLMFRKKKV